MKTRRIEDDGGAFVYEFTDPAGKEHSIKIVYNFDPAAITSVTFDGKVLDTVPQWRALAKYFQDQQLPLRNSRAIQCLACFRSQEDHADKTNPWCDGWKI